MAAQQKNNYIIGLTPFSNRTDTFFSSGYREYKTQDHYDNDVVALVFSPLARVDRMSQQKTFCRKFVGCRFEESTQDDALEIAMICTAGRIYGFRTDAIHKALNVEGLTAIPGSHPLLIGKIFDEDHPLPVIDFQQMIDGVPSAINDHAQVIILSGKKGRYGIVAEALGPIPSLSEDKIDFNASMLDAADQYTEGVILPSGSKAQTELIVLLDAIRLQDYLINSGTFKTRTTEFV